MGGREEYVGATGDRTQPYACVKLLKNKLKLQRKLKKTNHQQEIKLRLLTKCCSEDIKVAPDWILCTSQKVESSAEDDAEEGSGLCLVMNLTLVFTPCPRVKT